MCPGLEAPGRCSPLTRQGTLVLGVRISSGVGRGSRRRPPLTTECPVPPARRADARTPVPNPHAECKAFRPENGLRSPVRNCSRLRPSVLARLHAPMRQAIIYHHLPRPARAALDRSYRDLGTRGSGFKPSGVLASCPCPAGATFCLLDGRKPTA